MIRFHCAENSTQSLALAKRLEQAPKPLAKIIDDAYLLTLGRPPNKSERNRALSFLKEYERQYAATPQPVQVAFASVKADAKDAKPATVPENPDDIDRTDDTPSEKIIAADSANRAAWLSFSQ